MFRQVKYDYVRQNLKILFDLLQLNFIERKKDNSHFKLLNLESFITAPFLFYFKVYFGSVYFKVFTLLAAAAARKPPKSPKKTSPKFEDTERDHKAKRMPKELKALKPPKKEQIQ